MTDYYKGIIVVFLVLRLVDNESIHNCVNNSSESEKDKMMTCNNKITNQSMQNHKVLPIYGNLSWGYYYYIMKIGEPPMPISGILDTGSNALALTGQDCVQCCHQNHTYPPYNSNLSKTSKKLTCESQHQKCVQYCTNKSKSDDCQFYMSYQEGSSIYGRLQQDYISLDNTSNYKFKTIFVVIQKQTKYFCFQKANGIFGLGPKSDLLINLFQRQPIIRKRYSLCISQNGGQMTIGGANPSTLLHQKTENVSINYKVKRNQFIFKVSEISMNNKIIAAIAKSDNYQFIIDSGSTFSYFPKQKYTMIQQQLNEKCKASIIRCQINDANDEICYSFDQKKSLNPKDLDKIFPPIDMNIHNTKLKWLPSQFFQKKNQRQYIFQKNKNKFCLGILSGKKKQFLFGLNWMFYKDIVFDLESKKIRIYFNAKCKQHSDDIWQSVERGSGKYLKQKIFSYRALFIVIGILDLILGIIFMFQNVKILHEEKIYIL